MTFKEPVLYGVPVVDVLAASAARSEKGDVLALKVVNFAPFSIKTKINIAGMGKLAPTARTVLLTGNNLKLENTVGEPNRIVPVSARATASRRNSCMSFLRILIRLSKSKKINEDDESKTTTRGKYHESIVPLYVS